MRQIVIAFQLILLFAATAISQQENRFSAAGLNEAEVEQFFASFKEAVVKADKQKVASMVSYPIKANVASGRWKRIRNATEFIRAYDQIFDRKFKHLIIETDEKDLWAKSSGVATPRGEIWINGIVKDENAPDKYVIKITAINGPIRE